MNKRAFLQKIVKEILLEQQQLSKSASTLALQKWLNNNPENTAKKIPEDGDFGPKTATAYLQFVTGSRSTGKYDSAIKALQAKVGAKIDGDFGPKSRAALVKKLNQLDPMITRIDVTPKSSTTAAADAGGEEKTDYKGIKSRHAKFMGGGEIKPGDVDFTGEVMTAIGGNFRVEGELRIENCPNLETIGNGVQASRIIVDNCPKLVQFPNGKTDFLEISNCAKLVAIGNVTGLTQRYIGHVQFYNTPRLKLEYMSHLKIDQFFPDDTKSIDSNQMLAIFNQAGGDIKQIGAYQGADDVSDLTGDKFPRTNLPFKQAQDVLPTSGTDLEPLDPEDEPTNREKRIANRKARKKARKQSKVDRIKQRYGVS
jgi:hypothetical protein